MVASAKRLIKKIVFRLIKPPTKYLSNTYSQVGEDAIINFLINDKKIKDLSYLDIGTNNPDWGNNTYLFYLKGFRGVCVEADKSFISKIKRVRTEDVILNFGVGVESGKSASFYIFDEPSLNTFDKDEAESRQNQGTVKILSIESVEIKTISEIISENFNSYPDLLSLDIEGLDFMVLKSIDFDKFPIPIICAETCTYSENHLRPKNPEIADFMLKNGYFVYADTYVNTIFVRKKWFNVTQN